MQLEQDFMSRILGILGGRANNILYLHRIYVENIGDIFIESMNYDQIAIDISIIIFNT